MVKYKYKEKKVEGLARYGQQLDQTFLERKRRRKT